MNWIPITERLPDDDILVLLAFDDEEVLPGFLDGDTWRDYGGFPQRTPTHWSEMPDGPKAKRSTAAIKSEELLAHLAQGRAHLSVLAAAIDRSDTFTGTLLRGLRDQGRVVRVKSGVYALARAA